jgi:hypothetical protein
LTLEQQLETDSWFDNDGYTLARWPQGWCLTGGPRHRLFHRKDLRPEPMWKYPFFRMRPETIVYSEHWLWPHDRVTMGALGAVVHLHLMQSEVSFFHQDSKRYRGPRSLIRHGMMMPIDWQGEGQTRVDPQIDQEAQRT